MDGQQQEVARRPRLRGWRIAGAVLLVLLLAALLAAWLMRVRLATDYIDREFARRGVEATYDVKRIGFGTQVFENLVIGDPAAPDATAREMRVQILLGWTGPRIGLIVARGVRMRGRIVDGRLTLGEVDKLLPPPSGLPFRLPDQRVDVEDAAIVLDTPAGRVALGLSGRGNLADGFEGRLALASRGLRFGECMIDAPRGNLAVAVDDLRPRFEGPAAIASLRCDDDLAVERLRIALDATLAPALDSWRGGAAAEAAWLEAGPHGMARPRGRLTFAGDARRTAGALNLASGDAAVDMFRAATTRFDGDYVVSPERGDLALDGEVRVATLVLSEGALDDLAGVLRGAEGTPAGPIGAALAGALVRAGRGGASASARARLVNRRGEGGLTLERLRVAAASGAEAVGERITWRWPEGALRLDGRFALSGGGFPDARFALRQPRPGGPIDGVGRIAPMRAGGARLALGEIRFTAAPGGRTRFATSLRADGPLGDGRVAGLALPLSGWFGGGGFAVGEGCVDLSFRALRIEGLELDSARLPLCPVGPALVWKRPGGAIAAGARVATPRLRGRLGQSPIVMAADRLRVDLQGFAASGLEVRLGTDRSVNRLDVASLSARFVPRGVAGAYGGLEGQIAGVPLVLGEGEGSWRVVRGDLLLQGRVRIADERDPPRFYPLVTDDLRLTLIDNRIHAIGWLDHPASGTPVARATVDHDLRTGAGEAVLDVPGLAFGEGFQPDALTPLTVGVVALVEGTVTGRGRIEWDSAETRSTGTLATADMDLAAPFGPVEGLTAEIRFTDLLGLVTAPGQVAEVDLVRPGIDIHDGRIVYRLEPNYHVRVEGGRWPYAGGELILEPTLLDFSQPSVKYLTFRVVGMDAARFVQAMEFSNIAATGTFDGIIPLQVAQSGASIVDGRLSAREGGGTLSYVGELTDRDLGVYGKMAFDALKALRYRRFDMVLNGSLDGEFVTEIDLDGVARDPTAAIQAPGGAISRLLAGRALSQLARIPFEFNIRIQGPFRALLATARSFEDPSLLIQPVLPRVLRDLPTTVTDVQDEESENEP